MPDDVTTQTETSAGATGAPQGNPPAPQPETLTRVEAQELANRAAANTKREYESKIEALKAEHQEKLKAPPPKPTPPDDRIAALEFRLAFMSAAAEVGPIPAAMMARLEKLAAVDKPPDVNVWLRGELEAIGHKKPEAAAPVAGKPPVPPPNGTAPPAGVPKDPSLMNSIADVIAARKAGHIDTATSLQHIQRIAGLAVRKPQ